MNDMINMKKLLIGLFRVGSYAFPYFLNVKFNIHKYATRRIEASGISYLFKWFTNSHWIHQAQHGFANDSSQKVPRFTQQHQQQYQQSFSSTRDPVGQTQGAASAFERLHVQTDNDFWFTSFPPPSVCGPVSTNKGPQWAWPQWPVDSTSGSPIQQQPSTMSLWHY